MWPLLAMGLTPQPVDTLDHELDFEIRSVVSRDPSWDAFNDTDGFGTWGLRGAYALSPQLKIAASWSHGGRGLGIVAGEESFQSHIKIETLGLGLRTGWLYSGMVGPTATLQALGLYGTARWDEVRGDDENPGQYVRRGFALGGSLTAGLEVRYPTYSWAEPAFALELGYLLTGPMALGETGDLSFGGLTARGTLGMRF